MRFESQAQGDPLRLTVSRAPVVVPFPLPMLVDHAFGELVDSLPKAVTIGRRSQFLDALVQVCRGSQRQTRMTVLMFSQRRDEAVLAGLWEFPGGRVEEGETDEAALRREVLGRIGVEVEVGERVAEREHPYDGYDLHLTMFACKLPPDAEPHALGVKEVRWVGSGEFTEYKFPPADQATMDQLLEVKRWP